MRDTAAAGRRWRKAVPRPARLVVVAATALLSLGLAPGVAAARPTDPGDGAISAAQHTADSAAARLGQISAALAAAQTAVQRAEGEANIALDTYEGKEQDFEDARAAAALADEKAGQAQAALDAARSAVSSFARDSYISGSTSSRMTSLLTSGSPSQVLERAALLDAAGDRRSQVLDRMTVAEEQAAATQAAARSAMARADTLRRQAAADLATAERLYAAARQQAAGYAKQRTAMQAQVAKDKHTLAALQGQRAAALAYDRQVAAAASSGGGYRTAGYATTTSRGSPSAIATAVNAAERWLGTRYAWGGGSLVGPSMGWGIDAGVVGFDCSGLTRYAYARAGITIPRQSRVQYAALPKVPSNDLQAGDLVFYAFDTGDPSTIHHVAMYLGGGRMIEAPESGETVHITAMRWGGFIGAVRPSA
jgi:cell wall-associated NlpC family hydrolase